MKNKENLSEETKSSKPSAQGPLKLAVLVVILAALGVGAYLGMRRPNAGLDKTPLPQLSTTVAPSEAEIELTTTAGTIDIKLFPKLAPKAVENFLTLAKEGYYKDNQFFRVLNNFMIQTGSKDNSSAGNSKSIWGSGYANEISKSLWNIRGAVSLANSGQANTNGSQFFIVQNPKDASSAITDKTVVPQKILDAYKKGGVPTLDGSYTVFGQVISGMSVVDKIANGAITSATDSTGQSAGAPKNPFKITSVKIVKGWNFKSNAQTSGDVVNSK
ncbi:MAG: peptidylprolyl isomerase [Streptococcaceae bacterium]|jgi:peptidyl-prolyl cis-trans isomerase A (cyclophilin A)|nr:peptidylprolyl isomerase [Streptococcaceae bacterium]